MNPTDKLKKIMFVFMIFSLGIVAGMVITHDTNLRNGEYYAYTIVEQYCSDWFFETYPLKDQKEHDEFMRNISNELEKYLDHNITELIIEWEKTNETK